MQCIAKAVWLLLYELCQRPPRALPENMAMLPNCCLEIPLPSCTCRGSNCLSPACACAILWVVSLGILSIPLPHPAPSLLYQCLCCVTTGNCGWLIVLPRPHRKLTRTKKDSEQFPLRTSSIFFVFVFLFLLLVYPSLDELCYSTLQIWVWLEAASDDHLGFCPNKTCKSN